MESSSQVDDEDLEVKDAKRVNVKFAGGFIVDWIRKKNRIKRIWLTISMRLYRGVSMG